MANETIREDYNSSATQLENDSGTTILEEQSHRREALNITAGSKFRDYRIVKQLPSASTEADIFIIEKNGSQFFLKLYRFGIDPKIDILKSVKALSEKYPSNFIKIFETDFDAESKRWFEVQEYVTSGSLQAVIDKLTQVSDNERRKLFTDVAREAGEALNILHENGFLHRDVKPSNILVRSLNPLNIAVIDFGIASTIESDMSKKATRLGGTPMYQSPESFSSVADAKTGERRVILGFPSDWWGLGMILLEIAAGTHPFRGLSPNVIAYSLATEAVSIPEKIDAGQKELLKGLLTRNPEKRWGWEQVSRWLKGERGIPNFFDEAAGSESTKKRPLAFMRQKYTTLEEVAKAFAKDEASWIKGREFLMRGNINVWLRGNQDFDIEIDVDAIRASKVFSDSDEKVFRFINTYGGELPFVFGGHAITVKNLFIFTAKAQKREAMTEMEKKVVDMLLNGRLLSCYESYLADKTASDKTKTSLSLLRNFKGKNLAVVSVWLDFYMHPKKYHCPFLSETSILESAATDSEAPTESLHVLVPARLESIIRESLVLAELPMTVDKWNRINSKFIVPSDIVEQMKSADTYSKAVSAMKSMTLIQRGSYTDREIEMIRILQPTLKTEERIKKVLDFCVHPEKYYCPFIKDISSQEQLLEAAKALDELPMTKAEWDKFNNDYILSEDFVQTLVHQMESVSSYRKAVSSLRSATLIPRRNYTNREIEVIRILLPDLKTETRIKRVLDFCVHPEKYHCPFVKDISSQEQLLEAAKALDGYELPMTKAEWDNINAGFILPEKLLSDTKSFSLYHDAIAEILKMKNGDLLFRKSSYSQADSATKKELASSSIEDYKRAVYRVQWGYDDTSAARIESSLSEMRNKLKSSSGFDEAQCKMWIAYLEYLSSKSAPLTDEDKRILRNVSLRNTDEVERRIATIIK